MVDKKGFMKTIGLIGGMSWESSIEYYKIINCLIQQGFMQEPLLNMLLLHRGVSHGKVFTSGKRTEHGQCKDHLTKGNLF